MDALDPYNGMTVGEIRPLLDELPDDAVITFATLSTVGRVAAADVRETVARVNSIAGPAPSTFELRLTAWTTDA